MPNIWGIFIGFLENVILTLSNLTHSSGLGIILFTIAVRLLTLPFTISALREMRRRQEVQPLIDELKRRYGDDRTGMMIAAYRMAVEGWTAEEARKEMNAFGFHNVICASLVGYEKSFPERLKKSSAFKDAKSTE